jgi:DnaJ-class molecular chaperone
MPDYYSILGLNKNASESEIKKSYRKLALQHHPDRGGDEQKFKEIQKAYEVLSDSEKKRNYDQFGDEEGREDILSQMFGGGGFPQRQRKQNPTIVVKVSILEAWVGGKKEVIKKIKKECVTCMGTGTKDGKQRPKCRFCNGEGYINQMRHIGPGMMQRIQMPCNVCKTTGFSKDNYDKCLDCIGEGSKNQDTKIIINIPQGAMDGERIEEELNNGDLVNIIFKVVSDERYKKQKLDLISPLYLKLKEAINGFSKEYIFPDGSKEQISYNKTLYHGSIMRMRRKGFEREGVGKGSLILVVHVCYDDYPTKQLSNKKYSANIECVKSTETLLEEEEDDDVHEQQQPPQCHQQ